MAGGDFLSRAEGRLCAQRKIDERARVHDDLNAIVRRHGSQGAHAQLGLVPGAIDAIAARKKAITADLLDAMYVSGKGRLREGLASIPGTGAGIDADVAKLMAAARGDKGREAGLRAPAADSDAGEPDDAAVMELMAIVTRARAVTGTLHRAAAAIGVGASTLSFVQSGSRPFTPHITALVRAWDAANPAAEPHLAESNLAAIELDKPVRVPLTADGRAAVEAAALREFGLDRAAAVAIIAAAREHGLSLFEVGAQIGCQPQHVRNLISGNRVFTPFITEKLVALRAWSAVKDAEKDDAAANGELEIAGVIDAMAFAPEDDGAGIAPEDVLAAPEVAAEDRGAFGEGAPPAPVAAVDAAPPAVIEVSAVVGGETMVVADGPHVAALPSSPLFDSEDPVAAMLTLLQQQHEAARAAAIENEAQANALNQQAVDLAQLAFRARSKVVRLQKAITALTELAA